MDLRPATEADLPALVQLSACVQQLHAEHVPGRIKMPSSDSGCTEFFRRMLPLPTAAVVVAIKEGELAGFYFAQEVCQEENWVRPALRAFVLEHISVASAFQREGIGSALVEHFFAEARERGISCVELVCWEFNENAQFFFERHGFRRVYARMERCLN